MVRFNQDKYNKNNLDRNKVFAACAKCIAETIQHVQQHPLLEKISKLKKGGKHIEQQYMQILNKYIDFPAFDNQQVDGAACYKYRPDRLYLDGTNRCISTLNVTKMSIGDYYTKRCYKSQPLCSQFDKLWK